MVSGSSTFRLGSIAFLLHISCAAAIADPIGVTGAGLSVVGGDADVSAYYLGADAKFRHFLFLAAPFASGPMLPSHVTAAGTAEHLGTFAAGTRLTFGLHVLDTGDQFFTGLAAGNADGIVHAATGEWTATPAIPVRGVLVSFEDLLGGGDADYNDYRFVVSNVSASDAPVPEPATLFLVGSGVAACIIARKKRMDTGAAARRGRGVWTRGRSSHNGWL